MGGSSVGVGGILRLTSSESHRKRMLPFVVLVEALRRVKRRSLITKEGLDLGHITGGDLDLITEELDPVLETFVIGLGTGFLVRIETDLEVLQGEGIIDVLVVDL